jgi:hypothetical protein
MDLGSLVRRLVPGGRSPRAGPGAAATPITAGEWRSLPPIRTAAGPAPLVAPNAPFKAELATARRAPIALATLGHERRLEAPAGLSTGIATPVQRSPAAPVPASVRRPTGANGRSIEHAAVAMEWPDAGVREPGSEDKVAAPSDDGLAATPVIARAIDAPSLLAAPSPGLRPAGLVGAAAAAQPVAVMQARPVAASQALPVARWAAAPDADAPVLGAAGTGATPGGSGGTPPAPLVGTASPIVARRTRLGAPLASAGPLGTAPGRPGAISRTAADPRPGDPAMPPAVDAPGPKPAANTDAAAALPGSAPAPVVARASDALPGPGPVVPWRPAMPDRAPVSPLVGGLRPVLDLGSPTVIAMPGAPEPPAGRAEDAGGPVAALAALARVDPSGGPAPGPSPSGAGFDAGGRPASRSGTAQPRGRGGYPATLAPVVARDLADEGTPFAVAGSRLTWSNPWIEPEAPASAGVAGTPVTAVAGPAGMGWSTPTSRPASSPGGQASRAAGIPSQPGGFALRPRGLRVGPAIQRHASDQHPAPTSSSVGTTALDGGHAASSAPIDWTGGPMVPVVARTATADATPFDLAPVQRVDEAPAAAREGASGAGAAAPGDGGAPGSPAAEKDLDDLARRLYDRIGLRLRHELLVERERSGALVDRGF